MKVAWIVADPSVNIASTRYRCFYPALALADCGIQNYIFQSAGDARTSIATFSAVIFVKRLEDESLTLANEAYAHGVKIYIDLCDNVVVSSYTKQYSVRPTLNLIAVSAIAEAVVTASAALADAVRPLLPRHVRCVEIPDQIENRATFERATALSGTVQKAAKRHEPPAGQTAATAVPRARTVPPVLVKKQRGFVALVRLFLNGRDDNARRPSGIWLWRGARFAKTVITEPSVAAARVSQMFRRRSPLQSQSPAAKSRAVSKASTVSASLTPSAASVIAAHATDANAGEVHAPVTGQFTHASIFSALPAEQTSPRKTVLWFGNYGAPHSDFGLLALLPVIPALEAVARDIDIELLVITNNRKLFDTYIAPAAVPTRYIEWSADAVFDAMYHTDVCIFPFGHDAFSVTKSSNRPVFAFEHGVPVISSRLASLEPLSAAIVFDDWEGGLRRFLGPGADAAREVAVAAAREVIDRLYAPAVIGRAWLDVLQRPARKLRHGYSAATAQTQRIGILLNLAQDHDILFPIIDRLRLRRDIELRLLLGPKAIALSPRTLRAIIDRGIVPYALDGSAIMAGDDRIVRDLTALLTASETSLNPHKIAHALTKSAAARGVRTFTLQHGLENVGLSFFDDVQGRDVVFAADAVLTWSDPAAFPEMLRPETRAKCIAVGRSSSPHPTPMPPPPEFAGRPVVAIFENLHWHRYSSAYREAFVRDLIIACRGLPEVAFVVKPHHAGRYLIKNAQLLANTPSNLLFANLDDPRWEPYTAPALIPLTRAVITTPSTVALDAAELGVPVAVAGYDLDLAIYAPLPILGAAPDWFRFIDAALTQEPRLQPATAAFRDRLRMPGDAVGRICDILLNAAHVSSNIDHPSTKPPGATTLEAAPLTTRDVSAAATIEKISPMPATALTTVH